MSDLKLSYPLIDLNTFDHLYIPGCKIKCEIYTLTDYTPTMYKPIPITRWPEDQIIQSKNWDDIIYEIS